MHRPSIHRRGFRRRSAAAWSSCWAQSTACAWSAKRNPRPKRSPESAQTQPDCVVLDFQLIGGTAVDVLRAVHPVSPEIAFIVLTNHPTAQYRRVCMEAGRSRFLDKSTEFGKLKDVVAECMPTRC